MHLIITEPGWAGFDGDFGGEEFVDGKSVRDNLSERELAKLSNLIACELTDGTNPSSAQRVIDTHSVPLDVLTDLKPTGAAEGVVIEVPKFTRLSLEAIASAKGIEGLREIASPMGIHARSINALIDSIVAQQTGASEDDITLEGVRNHAKQYDIGGVMVQLSTVIRTAFDRSKLTVTEWNEQPVELREKAVDDMLVELKK